MAFKINWLALIGGAATVTSFVVEHFKDRKLEKEQAEEISKAVAKEVAKQLAKK